MTNEQKLLLPANNDRDMLEYLNEACDEQVYVCEQCGHEEPLNTFDIASDLRDYEGFRAAQKVADGLQEPVAIVGSDYQLLWFSPVGMETLVQACKRTGLKVGDKLVRASAANAMAAQIAELEEEKKSGFWGRVAGEAVARAMELEAQLAKGKDGLPEPVAFVNESDDGMFVEFIYGEDGNPLRRGDNLLSLDAVQPLVARLQGENERLSRVNISQRRRRMEWYDRCKEQEDLAIDAEEERDTLRIRNAELEGLLLDSIRELRNPLNIGWEDALAEKLESALNPPAKGGAS